MKEIPDKVVVDASSLIAWFSNESESEPVLRLMVSMVQQGTLFYAPTLLLYEVVNVLRYGKRLESAEIHHTLELFYQFGIILMELDNQLLRESIEYMLAYRLSFYDATYVGLANVLHVPLLTLDKRLMKVKGIEVL